MQRVRHLFLALCLTALALTGCKKAADTVPPPSDKPAAQTAAAATPEAPPPAPKEEPLAVAKRLLEPKTAQDLTDGLHAAIEALAKAKVAEGSETRFAEGEEAVPVFEKALNNALSARLTPPLDDAAKAKLSEEVQTIITETMTSGPNPTRVLMASRACTELARKPENLAKVVDSLKNMVSAKTVVEIARCVFTVAPSEIAARARKAWDPNETADQQLALFAVAEGTAKVALIDTFTHPALKGNTKVAAALAAEWDNKILTTNSRYTILMILKNICAKPQMDAIAAKLAGAADPETQGLLRAAKAPLTNCP
ncbi:MAG: hypothetical protein ACOYOB_15845 [Myxococcota bacterium]